MEMNIRDTRMAGPVSKQNMNKLLIICGPTATGKTKAALQLAKGIGGELVSADSRQVYKGMDIVTGKDLDTTLIVDGSRFTVTFQKKQYSLFAYDVDGVSVWMYDVVEPDEPFSVGVYQQLASCVIDSIYKRKHIPIVVGGTGLYIRSIIEHLDSLTVPPDFVLREQLSLLSVEALQHRLQNISMESWDALNHSDKHNPRRLIRRIEIAMDISPNVKQQKHFTSYDTYLAGLMTTREELRKRIDTRVEKRMKEGAFEEISALREKGYDWSLPSMSGLGYKDWIPYLTQNKQNISVFEKQELFQACVESWKTNEHKYAKRQMTWFAANKEIHWFDCTDPTVDKLMTADIMRWYTK